VTHTGGCHCGAVRFEVDAPKDIEAHDCNCSVCHLTGFQHLIVPAARFRLICGEEVLSDYQFKTRTAHHLFCSQCGVKSYYVPRSNPDGYSVNVRCLDPSTINSVVLIPFDGQNWESAGADLADLSRSPEQE
jgi:hypothetical protein